MLFELLALIGTGAYAYSKMGSKGKDKVKKSFSKFVSGGKGNMRHLEEVDRVQFGAYIPSPHDTQYFEVRWNDTIIPCANDITKAIQLMKTQLQPPVRVRASCSVCKEGNGYVHRWMFCCDSAEAVGPMNMLMESVQSEYFGQ